MCHHGWNISQLHIDIDIYFLANSHQSKVFDVGQQNQKVRHSHSKTRRKKNLSALMQIVKKCSEMASLRLSFNGLKANASKECILMAWFRNRASASKRFSVHSMHQMERVQRIRSHSGFSSNWPEILGTQTAKHDGREMTTVTVSLCPQRSRMKVGRKLYWATGFNKGVM